MKSLPLRRAEKALELVLPNECGNSSGEPSPVMPSAGVSLDYVLQYKPHCGPPVYRNGPLERRSPEIVEKYGFPECPSREMGDSSFRIDGLHFRPFARRARCVGRSVTSWKSG